MDLIKNLVLSCRKCQTVTKIPLSALDDKDVKTFEGFGYNPKSDKKKVFRCPVCEYNFSDVDGKDIANDVLELILKHNSATLMLESKKLAGISYD